MNSILIKRWNFSKEAEIERKNKEIFDLRRLENLKSIKFTYDKRLLNFFNHIKLTDIEIFNLKEKGYVFSKKTYNTEIINRKKCSMQMGQSN